MSNGPPVRACLADSPFMTVAPDPTQEVSCSAETEGGTVMFMAPELLVPEAFDKKDTLPTLQADVYAFGLVIYQVCPHDYTQSIVLQCAHFLQVLTGEFPFGRASRSAIGYYVVSGERPTKPTDPEAIGFSDELWDITSRCWSTAMESRPEIGEVVTVLGEATANWEGLMPSHAQTKEVPSDSSSDFEEDSELGEFEILILP